MLFVEEAGTPALIHTKRKIITMKPTCQSFGYNKTQWEAFKAEARAILVAEATRRGMITYGDLAKQMTTIPVEAHDMVLWEIIGDVGRDEEQAGRGILSVLVVHKHGDMEPGGGFYDLAKFFGRKTTDRTKCFVEEMHKVHAVWRALSENQESEQIGATNNMSLTILLPITRWQTCWITFRVQPNGLIVQEH